MFLLRLSLHILLCFLVGVLSSIEKSTIAFIYDGEEAENDPFYRTIREEIQDLFQEEMQVSIVSYFGNWTMEGATEKIKEALADSEINALVTAGLFSSYAAYLNQDFSKPIAIPYLLSEETQQTIEIEDIEIPRNLIILKGSVSLLDDLKALHSITPFRRLAVIGDASIIGEEFVVFRAGLASALKNAGIEFQIIPVTGNIDKILKEIETFHPEAIYFFPTWRVPEQDFDRLVEKINNWGIPSFSYLGEPEVLRGVMLTTTPKSHFRQVSRRIALNLLEILEYGPEAVVDHEFSKNTDVIINGEVAEKIGVELSWKIQGVTRVVHPHKPQGEKFNLVDAVRQAIERNFSVEIKKFSVCSALEEIKKANANRLPQLFAIADARAIDKDRAEISFGLFPQYVSREGLKFTQSIYNEELWAEYDIKKREYCIQKYGLEQVFLEVILAASSAYFKVLRAQDDVKIEYDNLNLTKANLRRSEERLKSGEAGKSEVYRWESQISSNQQVYISKQALFENSQAEFNRVLNRAYEHPFVLAEGESFENPFLEIESFDRYFSNSENFQAFRFSILEMAENSDPELRAAEQQIAVYQREYVAAKRSHYLPKISALGEFAHVNRGGAGKRPLPGFHLDNYEYVVGVEASLPLYTSGKLNSQRDKACYEMRRAIKEWQSIRDRIEEHVVQRTEILKARHHAIYFARQAEQSAEKNLDLVTDAYMRGAVSIVDLLDAQNALVIAKQSLSNAVYDFYIELMRVLRLANRFDLILSKNHYDFIMGK